MAKIRIYTKISLINRFYFIESLFIYNFVNRKTKYINMKLFKTIVLVAAIAFGASAYAATIDGAKLSKVEFSDGSVFRGFG